ncbi:hypothetical protein RO3G_04303 [Rhizopus delemar RA 99-880]|uniref:Uncharacterized protein n=1 Tax=Rhizopus delemar (strain RA 99-880 / ATCC MYA-4621 / FGSC 9543 / NRRL 43880) TaxID=246409 RepID=I1BTR8_RHIO9|nr:hypothetical protein RO3G_04303 [Rhizopus delemar RA 99-880]|eukprot:EIE79598.1 hypothetical protein RO3G_04303 [Rhizopus delemar RA 99-880]
MAFTERLLNKKTEDWTKTSSNLIPNAYQREPYLTTSLRAGFLGSMTKLRQTQEAL